MIKRFDHLTIVVRDLADARRFFGLLGFEGDGRDACQQVESALAPFSVPDDPGWTRRKPIELLDDEAIMVIRPPRSIERPEA